MAKDLFSNHAVEYAKYRPLYPDNLYQYIFQFVEQFGSAWDCGTGNGQVARVLANHFRQVYATDLSEAQLHEAPRLPNIHYRAETGEQCSAPSSSFDLITVAQAVHWFDFDMFYRQVNRVLKPEGVIAVWVYEIIRVDDALDEFVLYLYEEILGSFWAPERKYIEDKLQTIPFPFSGQTTAEFRMEVEWNHEQLLGYLNSWSAWGSYYQMNPQEKNNENSPMERFKRALQKYWPNGERRTLWFPVYLRMGTMEH